MSKAHKRSVMLAGGPNDLRTVGPEVETNGRVRILSYAGHFFSEEVMLRFFQERSECEPVLKTKEFYATARELRLDVIASHVDDFAEEGFGGLMSELTEGIRHLVSKCPNLQSVKVCFEFEASFPLSTEVMEVLQALVHGTESFIGQVVLAVRNNGGTAVVRKGAREQGARDEYGLDSIWTWSYHSVGDAIDTDSGGREVSVAVVSGGRLKSLGQCVEAMS
jgi:hypothetical protein